MPLIADLHRHNFTEGFRTRWQYREMNPFMQPAISSVLDSRFLSEFHQYSGLPSMGTVRFAAASRLSTTQFIFVLPAFRSALRSSTLKHYWRICSGRFDQPGLAII